MEPKPPLQPERPNLLDKIAADPEFVNRSAAEATGPVAVAEVVPVKASDILGPAEPITLDRDGKRRVPLLNLLRQSGAAKVPGRTPRPVMVAVAGVLVAGIGAGAYMFFAVRPAAVVAPRPTAAPVVSALPSPAASPVVTSVPTPASSPALTVTAPAAPPTADHPQAVTITSRSGLWLRSSATSAKRDNIIGWMPDGAQISVDATGDFWWHGTFRGRSGYFASKYTQ